MSNRFKFAFCLSLISLTSLVIGADLGSNDDKQFDLESFQDIVSDAKDNILEELERGQVRNIKFVSKNLAERGFFIHNPTDSPSHEALVESLVSMIKKRTGPFEDKEELNNVYQIFVADTCETIKHEMKQPFKTFQENKTNEDVIDNLTLQTLEWITYASICEEISHDKERMQNEVTEAVFSDPEMRKDKVEDE